MSAVCPVICTMGVVRMVPSPLGRHDLPWAVMGDVLRMFGVDAAEQPNILGRLRSRSETRTIVIKDAVEVIAPYETLTALPGIGNEFADFGTIQAVAGRLS